MAPQSSDRPRYQRAHAWLGETHELADLVVTQVEEVAEDYGLVLAGRERPSQLLEPRPRLQSGQPGVVDRFFPNGAERKPADQAPATMAIDHQAPGDEEQPGHDLTAGRMPLGQRSVRSCESLRDDVLGVLAVADQQPRISIHPGPRDGDGAIESLVGFSGSDDWYLQSHRTKCRSSHGCSHT